VQLISLIQGLLNMDRTKEGMSLIEETIQLVTANGDLIFMPELLRVKGNTLLSSRPSSFEEVERCFATSLEWSRRQGALGWELRTAIDLARLRIEQNRHEDARVFLQPLVKRFEKVSDTADLKIARQMLANL
jgi:predicted ATPase